MMYFMYQKLYLWESLPNMIINISEFYIVYYWVFPKNKTKLSYPLITTKLILLLIAVIITKYYYTRMIAQFDLVKLISLDNIRFFITSVIYRYILFAIYAGFIWFLITKNKIEKNIILQEMEKHKLSTALLMAEYNLIKSQINPHFLFNTLTFIYSKSVILNDEIVGKSILLLSDILRYSLQDIKLNKEVPLNNEVDYIKKINEINKLRFDGKFYVEISHLGYELNKKVPPFLLLTLFENALKYGDFQNKDHPVIIKITQKFDSISIDITNRKSINPNAIISDSFQIGQRYIFSTLENLYKNNYSFVKEDTEKIYCAKLLIYKND